VGVVKYWHKIWISFTSRLQGSRCDLKIAQSSIISPKVQNKIQFWENSTVFDNCGCLLVINHDLDFQNSFQSTISPIVCDTMRKSRQLNDKCKINASLEHFYEKNTTHRPNCVGIAMMLVYGIEGYKIKQVN